MNITGSRKPRNNIKQLPKQILNLNIGHKFTISDTLTLLFNGSLFDAISPGKHPSKNKITIYNLQKAFKFSNNVVYVFMVNKVLCSHNI